MYVTQNLKKEQGLLEKWLIVGIKHEKRRMSLEHVLVPENKF